MKKLQLIFSFLFLAFAMYAQPGTIPNQEPGKCYAESFIPNEYETQTETIVVKEATSRVEVIPAVYGTQIETVLKKEATTFIDKKPAVYSVNTVRYRFGCPDGYMDGLANGGTGLDECYKVVFTPPTYRTITEVVTVKEATTRLETVPAVYGKRRVDNVLLEEASFKIEKKPAPFTTLNETIEVSPATTEWVKKVNKNCLSTNPEDCYIWQVVEVPAQYKSIPKKVMGACEEGWQLQGEHCIRRVEIPATYGSRIEDVVITPPTTKEVIVPEESKTVTKKVVDRPAQETKISVEPIYQEYTKKVRTGCPNGYSWADPDNPSDDCIRVVEVPAEYINIKRKIMTSPASTQIIEVPEETRTITKKRLIKQGGYTEWREVVCANNLTPTLIQQIQNALIAKGYDLGTSGADAVMGNATKTALVQFQKDRALPIGNLDLKTLGKLGIRLAP